MRIPEGYLIHFFNKNMSGTLIRVPDTLLPDFRYRYIPLCSILLSSP